MRAHLAFALTLVALSFSGVAAEKWGPYGESSLERSYNHTKYRIDASLYFKPVMNVTYYAGDQWPCGMNHSAGYEVEAHTGELHPEEFHLEMDNCVCTAETDHYPQVEGAHYPKNATGAVQCVQSVRIWGSPFGEHRDDEDNSITLSWRGGGTGIYCIERVESCTNLGCHWKRITDYFAFCPVRKHRIAAGGGD